MRKLLIALLALGTLALIGCGSSEPEGKIGEESTTTDAQTPESGTTSEPTTSNTAPTGDGSGIAIHGAGAGGMAPVTGTENLQGSGGGGGGVGQAAKSAAKNAASSGSSLDQMPPDGE